MKKDIYCMKDLEIFSPLSEEEKNHITRLARGKLYKKGEFLFQDGDEADTIYLIRSGHILLSKTSDDGKQFSIDILGNGGIIGENTIFEEICYTFDAVSLENSYVCRCFKKDFLELLKNPQISMKIMKTMTDKVNIYTDTISSIAFYDVKNRVYKTLERISGRYGLQTEDGVLLDIFLSHEDIAHLSNASRVMVTNAISDLKKEGKISTKERHYIIRKSA